MTERESTQRRLPPNPLGTRPIAQLLVSFSVPAIISMLVNAIYNIVDQIFIGQGVGVLGNSATTVAFPLMTIMLAVSTMLGSGGTAYASIKMGEGNEEEANRALNHVLVLNLIMGVIIAMVGLLFLTPILRGFGAMDSVLPYAKAYAGVILLGAPFNMLSVSFSNLTRADGNPRFAMLAMVSGALLNIILDPIFIFIFKWGVAGAALATVLSQVVSAGLFIWYFRQKSQRMAFNRSYMRLTPSLCGTIAGLGISSCITQTVSAVMQVVLNNSLKYYGDLTTVGGEAAQAAMGVVIKVVMIMVSVGIGVGIGCQPILGFNRGARQYRRVRQTYLMAIAAATVLITAGWLCCMIFPREIISIFGSDSQEFMDFGVRCINIYLAGSVICGFQIVSTNYFQATGQPFKASILSMLRQLLLQIPLVSILPLWFGLDGILYAGPISDVGAAIIIALFMVPEMRRLTRLIDHPELEEI